MAADPTPAEPEADDDTIVLTDDQVVSLLIYHASGNDDGGLRPAIAAVVNALVGEEKVAAVEAAVAVTRNVVHAALGTAPVEEVPGA